MLGSVQYSILRADALSVKSSHGSLKDEEGLKMTTVAGTKPSGHDLE